MAASYEMKKYQMLLNMFNIHLFKVSKIVYDESSRECCTPSFKPIGRRRKFHSVKVPYLDIHCFRVLEGFLLEYCILHVNGIIRLSSHYIICGRFFY